MSKPLKRILSSVVVTGIIAALALLFAGNGFRTLFGKAAAAADEVTITSKSLSFRVESNGVLRATSVQNFGGPPAFGNYWQFQIVSMVPEGKNVNKGEVLINFDAQKIRDDLQRFQNELDQASKSLERVEVQTNLERQELTARLAAAENNYEKLKLKQKTNAATEKHKEILKDDLKLKQAKEEVEKLKEQLEWKQKSSEANYKVIASRKARAENAVKNILAGIERFQAKADRDGVVVYKTKWNGERFQIGEMAWSGQPLMEIPDLNTLMAEAFVPEVDLGKITVDQPVEIAIDAFPGKTYNGRVKSIGTLVRPKSWDIQNKIIDVQITLEQLDTSIMRPGMSIKAKIVTSTLADCTAVPIRALRIRADGAFVKLRADGGWIEHKVTIGDSNGSEVVITEGLKAGDRIAAEFSKAQ